MSRINEYEIVSGMRSGRGTQNIRRKFAPLSFVLHKSKRSVLDLISKPVRPDSIKIQIKLSVTYICG
jgi:hypothetical protein